MKNVGASERRMCLLACRGEYQGPWRPRAARAHREPTVLDGPRSSWIHGCSSS